MNIETMINPVPLNAKMEDEGYLIWCGTMVRTEDGKCHLFYSRWKKELGHFAWVTDCEIAYAVADEPMGAYKHMGVVLKGRGKGYWDAHSIHNPACLYRDGKFYLYYVGTSGNGLAYVPETMEDENWWTYRNSQRIGVAVASDPLGEWQRFDRPVLDVSEEEAAFDSLMVSNPGVTVDDKGRFVMVYKGVRMGGRQGHGTAVKFGSAFADSPLGPFVKNCDTIFEEREPSGETYMVAEDPFIWYQSSEQKFYAITRDVVGKFTGESGGLALFDSRDGAEWKPSAHPKVLGSSFTWANGVRSESHVERPWLYLEDGVPRVLFGAAGEKNRAISYNIRIPLE